MINKIISLSGVLFLLLACEKEPDPREFPILRTLDPISIDETGATFRAEIVQGGKNEITSYGFVWSIPESNKPPEKVILGNEPSGDVFETRINYSLSSGFEYNVRAFATYNEKTVYGNVVTIISEGSEKSYWTKELSDVDMESWDIPYGWADGTNGYVIYQNSKVYRFDPNNKQFTELAKCPVSGTSGTRFTAIPKNNIQYLLGDNYSLYKLQGGVWSVQSALPFYYDYFNGYVQALATSNHIFFLSSSYAYSYNPETDIWNTQAAMPTASYSIGGTDLNGYAYVMDCEKQIQQYDPVNNTWQYISTFPGDFPEGSVMFGRYEGYVTAFSYGNSIFFGFTYCEYSSDIEESIWEYNLSTDTWKEIPFPLNLGYGKVFFFYLKDKFYLGHHASGKFTIYTLDTAKL